MKKTIAVFLVGILFLLSSNLVFSEEKKEKGIPLESYLCWGGAALLIVAGSFLIYDSATNPKPDPHGMGLGQEMTLAGYIIGGEAALSGLLLGYAGWMIYQTTPAQ